MRFTIKRLLLVILIAAALSAGLTLGLRAQGIRQPQQESTSSTNSVSPLLMPTYSYLKQVARVSDLIVKGEVLPGSEIPVDIGSRRGYLSPYAINPVKIIAVFKGTAPADIISVGEMVISSEGDWRLEPGRQAYLFLRRVEHGTYTYTVPYDYFTEGPQGQYYVRNGLIKPKGDAHLATTKQFSGVKEEVFVRELRRAIEP